MRSLASPLCTLVALAPLFVATRGVTAKHALGLGWLSATVASFIGYAFVPPALSASGALSPLAAWAALLGFALFRGAWLGLAFGLGALAQRRGSLVVSAIAITALELVLPNPLPFALGTPLVMWPPIAQVASVLGASGLTLIAALFSAGLAALVTREKRDGGRAWGVVAVGALAPTLAAIFGLAQLELVEPTNGQLDATLLHTARDPLAPGALPPVPAGQSLLVLPESAVPLPLPDEHAEALARDIVAAGERPVIFGLSERVESGRLRNVALYFEPGNARAAGRYEKQELLPFAEAGFDPGREIDAIAVGGTRISVAICSEELGADAIRRSVQGGGEVIVALGNDAWFQGSYAGELHLLAARARAIETHRSVLRSSNGGVTAAIDPYGRVIARTSTPGALEVSVPTSRATTPYLRWGTLPLWSLLAASALIAVVATRRSAPPAR